MKGTKDIRMPACRGHEPRLHPNVHPATVTTHFTRAVPGWEWV